MYSYVINIKPAIKDNADNVEIKRQLLYRKLAALELENALVVSESKNPFYITLYVEYKTIQEADKLLPKLQEVKTYTGEESEITVFIVTNKLTL